ncbi:MAG TPA: type I-E CRISPR-associated protein Cas5/CasD [Candidatus Paceibacterota bacterium]|nr:type I-E CRISPR-associated protein Cas5/CasD [Verrucomicrobiota bacterium]HRY49790.1 type I-E CRISPR-associated protein Cas5/CasD [Candidatus Paceibacterota bacterium]
MLANACLALLLDGPMQSWGHASRFERRTTALHPTRSGVFGLIAAAMGINKHDLDEADQLARLQPLRITTVTLLRRNRRGDELPILRLEDYHTVAFTREAGANASRVAKLLAKANGPITAEDRDSEIKPTKRHYLLDARFGVLLEGPAGLIEEVAAALSNPKWGVWLGRKCCLPASPVLAAPPGKRANVWPHLLQRAGFAGTESIEQFDHVIETAPGAAGSDTIDDAPLGYGKSIGERHAPRWIRRFSKSPFANPKS